MSVQSNPSKFISPGKFYLEGSDVPRAYFNGEFYTEVKYVHPKGDGSNDFVVVCKAGEYTASVNKQCLEDMEDDWFEVDPFLCSRCGGNEFIDDNGIFGEGPTTRIPCPECQKSNLQSLLDKERADNVTLRAELTTSRQNYLKVAVESAALTIAFKRVSEIVSSRYGEDENEDSYELNDCFDVLQNADAGSALLDVLKPFAKVAREVREDRYSVFDTLSVSVLYMWLEAAEKALNGYNTVQ